MKSRMKRGLIATLGVAMLTTQGVFALDILPESLGLQRPTGLALSQDGTLYIADAYSNQVYQLDGEGLTPIAGVDIGISDYPEGVSTLLDGGASGALLYNPQGLALFGELLYVADTQNDAVRQLIAGQVHTLLDGEDGISQPTAIAVTSVGDLYLANGGTGEILYYDLSQASLSTYATGFVYPTDVTLLEDGTLLVVDGGSHLIQAVDTKGNVTLVAGQYTLEGDIYIGGYADGPADQAIFQNPRSILVDEDTYYITDYGNSALRKLENGQVSTLVQYDPWAETVYPIQPCDLVLTGDTLYVSDTMGGLIFTLSLSPFLDISSGDWFYDAVCYGVDNQLFQGTSDTTFSPNAPMTRATLTQILYNLEGQPQVDTTTDFTDVVSGSWYENSVTWAAEIGLTQGTSDTTFSPDGEISREELAVLLYRYAQLQETDLDSTGDLSGFNDADTISDWAQDAMLWAVSQGILTGTDQNALLPQDGANRAQGATMFMRLLEA